MSVDGLEKNSSPWWITAIWRFLSDLYDMAIGCPLSLLMIAGIQAILWIPILIVLTALVLLYAVLVRLLS